MDMKRFPSLLRAAAIGTALTAVLSLSACGSKSPNYNTEPGTLNPDTQQTDFTIMGGMSALSSGYEGNPVLEQLQEDAGINITWNTMSDSLSEQVNIRIAGNIMPDAFMGVGFNNYDLSRHGDDGAFIDLTPYITPEIMPNLYAILEENPGIRAAITMDDGGIYGLPAGEQMGTAGIGAEEDYSIFTIPQFSMINKAWLDELGLEVPTTLDELHTALKAFKDNDMSHTYYGNAAGSTIPMSTGFDQWCWGQNIFYAGFGFTNWPADVCNDLVLSGDGSVRFVCVEDNYHFRMAAQEHPEMSGNPVSRMWRKHRLKKQYQKQAREAAKTGAASAAKKTAAATEKAGAKIAGFVKRHPVGVLLALACVLLLFMMQSCSSSLVTIGNAGAGAVGATTYPSQDEEMLAAEAAYSGMEAELQDYLDNYESTHDYDEYHFDLDSIEHDPYVLISILSVLHEGAWTADQVQGTLETLFDRQYILTEDVVVEVRYRTESRTDSEGNSYTVEVPYNYYICYVTLENKNLSHLPLEIMSEEQMARYALYMSTLGNRPDLFPESAYVEKYITNPPADYDVPEEYLDDETFAAILEEAEKYLGYPYVWGGSSPATSFDCSGFVSWVINHSGWNVGRLGAQGLYNICTPTSNPKPGDLVFFVGTYDTAGVSHCGIYVGDGMMIHCGDPIQYANLNTSYWQSHFYAYGRLP